MGMKRRSLIFVIVLSVLAALAYGAFVGRPGSSAFTEGIDVSHHQGPIDWALVKSDGKAFVYMKATEGGDFVDPRFSENWQGARRAGLRAGAYHFFTLCKPAREQAANFLNIIGDQTGALPSALDLEHMGPCRESPTMRDPAAQALIFLDIIERETGARPIIYTTRQFHDAFLMDYTNEIFWNRSLFIKPRFRKSGWLFWQYSNRGHVKGIDGPVDLNKFKGDLAALEKLIVK